MAPMPERVAADEMPQRYPKSNTQLYLGSPLKTLGVEQVWW